MSSKEMDHNPQLLGTKRSGRKYPRLEDPNVLGSLAFRAKARVVDISMNGIGIECEQALPSNRPYWLTVRGGSRELRVKGKTVWNRLIDTSENEAGEVAPVYRAGLRFDDGGPRQQTRVREFISRSGARPTGSSPDQRYRPTGGNSVALEGEYGFVVKTISRSGALLETEPMTHHDASLELSMHLPCGEVEVEGRLVESYRAYDESGEPCTRVAVEFQDLSPDGHRQIGRMVAASDPE